MLESCMGTRTALAVALLAATLPALAAPGAESAYVTDPQFSQVEDATSRGIGDVNMIACIMAAMRPDALVNEPSYVALIDKNKCDSEKRSSTENAGGGTPAADYITATVTPTRASNSEPMITKAWLDLDEDGTKVQISVHISATEAASDANPYGAFRLDYCGQIDATGPCVMAGFIEAAQAGINYYDASAAEEQTTAMNLTVSNGGGAGKLEMHGGGGGDALFAFAYDQTLYHRDIDGDAQCFSRDASDPDTGLSVWRYGLYDAASGERVTRNSGFPIEFTHDGTTYNGFLGYYGLSLPPEAQDLLTNGAVVTKVDYPVSGGDPVRTDYSVMRSGGKLTKFTRRQTTLDQLDQTRFNVYVGSMEANDFFVGATPNAQYELYWDQSSGSFIVSGQMVCDQNGCQNVPLSQAHSVSPGYWVLRGGLQGTSQLLGGELFIDMSGVSGSIDAALVPVVYRSQDLVYPADLPAGLHCLQNCPSSATLHTYFDSQSNDPSASPFIGSTYNNFNPVQGADVVTYGANVDTATLTGGDGSSAEVVFTNAEAFAQHPMFQNGVMTGRLFANLDDALCDPTLGDSAGYCEYKISNAEVYYQWQTGPYNWNQFAAVKDDAGEVLQFQAPLQLNYHVPDDARFGEYANTNIVLQYNGYGDLWGIPGTCVSANTNETVPCNDPESRYVPAFLIPYDQSLGLVTSSENDTPYLVKWLDREIRFARKSGGECAALALPTDVELPTAALLQSPADPNADIYLGAKPDVTDPPRVIHGEVKY